jgi:diguanylate cyclase (GGDEF)-like protein
MVRSNPPGDLPPAAVIGIGVVLLALAAAADFAIGAQLTFAPVYLVVVLAGCWYGGVFAGWLLAALASAALLVAGLAGGHPYANAGYFAADVLGRVVVMLIAVMLVARLRTASERERRNAGLDALTGLPNRARFDSTLDLELARLQRFGRPFALVYIDCENFKAVKEREGHAAGDALLRVVAQTLGGALRKTDFSARLVGDQFGVLLPETDASTAGIVVEQMRERLLTAMREAKWPVTFSMGIAVFSRPVASLADAISRVDELMSRVRKRGRNGMLIETDGRRQSELVAEPA